MAVGILIAVTVTVQNAFHLEMHQHKIFYFLKIIFDISTSKRSENIKKNHFKQKKIKIFGTKHSYSGLTCYTQKDVYQHFI